MTEPSDAELMQLVRAGSREAFGLVMDRYKHGLVGYLARLTGQRDRAEDLAQETFVRLFQSAGSYREEGKLGPFLYRIATNLVRSEERRARRWRVVGQLFRSDVGRAPVVSPQAEVLRSETHRVVAEAVAALPLAYRVPLVLRDVEDWSYDEIARAIGCPEGTVKSRISRARGQLRETLARYAPRAAAEPKNGAEREVPEVPEAGGAA